MTEVLTGALYDGGVGGGGKRSWQKLRSICRVHFCRDRPPFAGGKSVRRRRRRENLSTFAPVLMNFIDIFHRNKRLKRKIFAPAARYYYSSVFQSYNSLHCIVEPMQLLQGSTHSTFEIILF